MSDDESEETTADTMPPDSGPGILEELGGLFDLGAELLSKAKKDDPTGRPRELWVTWRVVPGGVDILSCTVNEPKLGELPEGVFLGKFR